MKPQTNAFPVQWKTKRTQAVVLGAIFAGLLGCLPLNSQAAVQVTRFDPPLQISAYTDPTGDAFVNVFAADFDANGVVDFNLGYGLGFMSAYFNAPVRFGARVPLSNIAVPGPVAAVPLGSTIGTGIASSDPTNLYIWSSGYTNRDDLTLPLGDHEAMVLSGGTIAFDPFPGPISFSTNGTLVTNIIYPTPVVSGDVVNKDAVMALEFYIDGQPHYGYIHFNFNNGASGVIYGWAYETEPNTPIAAASLAPPAPPTNAPPLHSGIIGVVKEGNVSGWSVLISTAKGTFAKGVETDDDGYFKVDLAPGRYVLRLIHGPEAEPALATPNNSLVGIAKSVVVVRNHFTFVTVPTFGKAADSSQH